MTVCWWNLFSVVRTCSPELSSKTYFTNISRPGSRVISIFFLFANCSFSLLIVIIARRPLKLAILIALLFYYLFVGVILSYKYYFIAIFPWFNSSNFKTKFMFISYKKTSIYGRYVLPLVILYYRFFIFSCVSNLILNLCVSDLVILC